MGDPYGYMDTMFISSLAWLSFLILLHAICAGMCHSIAITKGYSRNYAAFTGLITGFLGLIYYAGLPDKRSQDALDDLLGEYRGDVDEPESDS